MVIHDLHYSGFVNQGVGLLGCIAMLTGNKLLTFERRVMLSWTAWLWRWRH